MNARALNLLALTVWLAAMLAFFWLVVTHVKAVLMIIGALIGIVVLVVVLLRSLN